MRDCVRALPVPRRSWLGCAVLVCVLGLGFWLRPATPTWGVGVCLCLCVRTLFVPRHSRLACAVWVCVLGLRLRLCPATPGWGVQVCVFDCVRAPLVPRHSWLGCAVWLCVLVLGFRLRPATPGWAVPGCVCFCARSASTPPLLAGVCGVGVFAWARGFGCASPLLAWVLGCVCVRVRAPLVPRHSWLGCAVWLCLLGLVFRVCSATAGWSAGVCVCLCVRSARTPPLLAGLCGVGLGVWARVSAAPRHSLLGCWGVCVFVCALRVVPCHSWLGRAVRVCVLGLAFRRRPATPGWGVVVCVCLRAHSACTPPLQAGVCGVGVRAWNRVSAAPRHSWLGCSGVCVFVCALRLYPATPGWGVRCGCGCLGSGFGCTPPLLGGVLGCVCVFVRAPLIPPHSWLGCAVWVWLLGLGFRPRPAAPVLGVVVCVCLREPSPLDPATPGWGVRCGCVCLGSVFRCAPPLLAGVFGCVCVFLCALCLYPATPGCGARCGCACLDSPFRRAPPLLAWVFGFVCVCVRAPLVPRHSWLGCAVLVWVFGLGFWLRPVTPSWGVGVCVCLCARSACTPPLLTEVCGDGVGVWARVLAAPRHS